MKNIKSCLSVVVVLMVCCACTFQTKHHGYVFPDNLESLVGEIKTTSDLQDKIGDPLVKTVYGQDVWVYYSADENYRGPLPMTYDNKTVLLVWTDKSGNILKTKVLHDNDLPDVCVDSDETEIPAAIQLNALEELFNNIGRFSPAGLGQ